MTTSQFVKVACYVALASLTLVSSRAHAVGYVLSDDSADVSEVAGEVTADAGCCDPGCAARSCCSDATCCGSSVGCCDDTGCCGGHELIGKSLLHSLLHRSDHCFDDFISPMTNPVFFEDPRTLTEARLIFINHRTPTLAGNPSASVRLFAMQVRAALTQRLSIIATKDGFITTDSPLFDDGWADVSAGLKYNLFRDPCSQTILSAGVTYELPVGSTRALQGNGDGEFHAFLTGMTEVAGFHVMSAAGVRLPSDDEAENRVFHWSNHVDRELFGGVYALAEVNWYHWLSSGSGFGLPVEGGDLFNLGSPGITGNNIVTGAFGAKYKPHGNFEFGVAWEIPLTERRGLLDNRLTADCIFRY